MLRLAYMPAGLAILFTGVLLSGHEKKDGKRAEERLLKLEARAKKIPAPAKAAEPARFLQSETGRLMAHSRALSASSYEFDRMLEAMDDLLDAREDLQAATQDKPPANEKEKGRDSTARNLERAYFRVQQADYFAKLSAGKGSPEYVSLARKFYQRARAAYDAREYWRANRLASASSELVNVLENLAQAAVRKREPPVLK